MEQIVTVMTVDSPGKNGVFYPRAIIIGALDDFKSRLQENNEAIPGEYQVPPLEEIEASIQRLTTILFSKVSHFVKSIWMNGDIVYAKIYLVGKYAELAKEGIEFTVFPRALGTISDDNMCSSYRLITLDLCDSHELVPLESIVKE